MSNQSQCRKILKRLLSGKTITPAQALKWWGCFRLSARIYDLKNDFGYPEIVTERVNQNGKTFARYFLP